MVTPVWILNGLSSWRWISRTKKQILVTILILNIIYYEHYPDSDPDY